MSGAPSLETRRGTVSACGSCSACGAAIKVVLRGVDLSESGVESHQLRFLGSERVAEGTGTQRARWRGSVHAAAVYVLHAVWHVVVMACIAYAVLWLSWASPAA